MRAKKDQRGGVRRGGIKVRGQVERKVEGGMSKGVAEEDHQKKEET